MFTRVSTLILTISLWLHLIRNLEQFRDSILKIVIPVSYDFLSCGDLLLHPLFHICIIFFWGGFRNVWIWLPVQGKRFIIEKFHSLGRVLTDLLVCWFIIFTSCYFLIWEGEKVQVTNSLKCEMRSLSI